MPRKTHMRSLDRAAAAEASMRPRPDAAENTPVEADFARLWRLLQ